MNALYRELDESQQKMIQSPGGGAETKHVVPCSQCKYDNKCMLQSFVESEGVEPIDRQTWYCADGERRDDD